MEARRADKATVWNAWFIISKPCDVNMAYQLQDICKVLNRQALAVYLIGSQMMRNSSKAARVVASRRGERERESRMLAGPVVCTRPFALRCTGFVWVRNMG